MDAEQSFEGMAEAMDEMAKATQVEFVAEYLSAAREIGALQVQAAYFAALQQQVNDLREELRMLRS